MCAYDHGGMDVGGVAGVFSPLWHGWPRLVMHAEHMPTPVVGAPEVCELGRDACHCRVFITLYTPGVAMVYGMHALGLVGQPQRHLGRFMFL